MTFGHALTLASVAVALRPSITSQELGRTRDRLLVNLQSSPLLFCYVKKLDHILRISSIDRLINQAIIQSVKPSVNRSISHPFDQAVNQWISSQSIGGPTDNQPVD